MHEQLSSPDPKLREHGVRRVQTWRTRGKLPVAVDVTASFIEVMLNDPAQNLSTTSPRGEHELQLLYGMCVVRLINGIVDAAQRGAFAQNMRGLAGEMDWPTWLVDLRHDISHRAMPSLQILRLAAKEALWLLFERFWRPQQEQLERRGRGYASYRGRLSKKPVPIMDKRHTDRSLKFLLSLAAMGGRSSKASKAEGPEGEGHTRDSRSPAAAAVDEDDENLLPLAAKDLVGLAMDEGRLLLRVFAVVMAGEPRRDGRQVRVLRCLCATSSENFSLRLARQVLSHALGWTGPELSIASDENPGLRNICDGHTTPHANEAGDSTMTELPQQEADRMLRWLEVFAEEEPGERLSAGRLRTAMQELAPWLRRRTLAQIAAVGQQDGRAAAALKLLSRAASVWQVLNTLGIDAGAESFVGFCANSAGAFPEAGSKGGAKAEDLSGATAQAVAGRTARTAGAARNSAASSSAAKASGEQVQRVAGAAGVASAKNDGDGGDSGASAEDDGDSHCKRPDALALDDVEGLVREKKRRRLLAASAESLGGRCGLTEPWTAIGSSFDTDTLQIHSRQEGRGAPELPKGAESFWLAWAAGGDAATALAAPSKLASVESVDGLQGTYEERLSVVDPEAVAVAGSDEDAVPLCDKKDAEKGFRAEALALFEDLEALGPLK